MPEIKKGIFTLNFGVFQMQTEISEDDRQCAWELYTELITRVALTGKHCDDECCDFAGEVLIESLDSLHCFFQEARGIMRKFPVGKLKIDANKHLGLLINELMVHVLRPFLEKWQSDFRHWWEAEANPNIPPFARQKEFPRYEELIGDWTDLRLLIRDLIAELSKHYRLTNIAPY